MLKLHHFCCTITMSFWEFDDDDSHGYYLLISNKMASNHGALLIKSLLSLSAVVLKSVRILLI